MANIIGDFINGVYSYGNTGSSMANAVSAGAQQNQFNFNSSEAATSYERQLELLGMQSAYNSAEATAQRDYNTALWNMSTEANRENAAAANLFAAEEAAKNRAFQAEQAELTRQWQERMSNTAYQRAVSDMKAAGINPILAAMNGGAGWSSGAQASGSQASASMANSSMASSGMASIGQVSAPQASGSNYTGQGNNMSENLAMLGAVASMFGSGLTGLGEALGTAMQSFDLVSFAEELGKQFGNKDGEIGLNDFGLEKTGEGIIGIIDDILGGTTTKGGGSASENNRFWNRFSSSYKEYHSGKYQDLW